MTPPVRATSHAVERARYRFPAEFPKDGAHHEVCIVLANEVEAAVAAGRMARNIPRWAHRSRLSKRTDAARKKPAARFVWNEEETRVYLIVRQNTVTLIITVLRGRPAAAAAA